MAKVNIYEAKTQLSRLVERAARGETIVIARNGRPMAALGPVTDAPPGGAREFGFLKDEWPPVTEKDWAESEHYLSALLEKSADEDI